MSPNDSALADIKEVGRSKLNRGAWRKGNHPGWTVLWCRPRDGLCLNGQVACPGADS